jgi:hypothetical protein
MGGRGASLEAAMRYSNVVFAGNILVRLMNGLASVIRGTGDMLFPSMVICLGVAFLFRCRRCSFSTSGRCRLWGPPAGPSPS